MKKKLINAFLVLVLFLAMLVNINTSNAIYSAPNPSVVEKNISTNSNNNINAGITSVLMDSINQYSITIESNQSIIVGSSYTDEDVNELTIIEPTETTEEKDSIPLNDESDEDAILEAQRKAALDRNEPITMYYNEYEKPKTMYLKENSTVLFDPDNDNYIICSKSITEKVKVIGEIDDFYAIKTKKSENGVGFIKKNKLINYDREFLSYNYEWQGTKLTSIKGKVKGPSGNETYYNLNMSWCISYMKELGYDYDYWVRSDGVKMYGDYVMVAADLSKRPKGTLVATTLGMGIVVDTGSFVNWDSYRLDIATTW